MTTTETLHETFEQARKIGPALREIERIAQNSLLTTSRKTFEQTAIARQALGAVILHLAELVADEHAEQTEANS